MRHEAGEDILRVTISGPLDLPRITSYLIQHQEDWSGKKAVLWDLRQADPTPLTSQDILNLDQAFAGIFEMRAGARTALLVGKELETIARISIALYEEREVPITFNSFCRESEAIAWLKEA